MAFVTSASGRRLGVPRVVGVDQRQVAWSGTRGWCRFQFTEFESLELSVMSLTVAAGVVESFSLIRASLRSSKHSSRPPVVGVVGITTLAPPQSVSALYGGVSTQRLNVNTQRRQVGALAG